ncbi:superoxide dismutase family protein [Thermostaphylospora chromogena]|uniref:Superoxide dismutase, Cu-Zn family n=1 Tax=Thermostaphylospora chromogena TaxID=35622 RepID=A0A1H1A1E5_9ACTN|nr:superoxide dismutase family protein [Thermostaphylospora chromogena]SDQ33116.1 superoxide dismutase, Cu-Zn family [Thermostaphylospora chromogena]
MRRFQILALALLSVGYVGCAGQEPPSADEPSAAAPAGATPTSASPVPAEIRLTGGGTFEEYTEGGRAIVYNRDLVPEGARAEVTVESDGEETTSELEVWGLAPNRNLGVHLHVNACGRKPDSSGPHFRHSASAAPESSPAPGEPEDTGSPAATPSPESSPEGTASPTPEANPTDEVWLDITTDESGHATATSTNPWGLSPDDLPKSLVIHEKPTQSEGPDAGSAGGRAACITLTPATGS